VQWPKFVLIAMFSAVLFMACESSRQSAVRKEILPNGLTVLIKEDHSSPVVSIVTWVKAGYFNEPDSLTGISHLLEHMFFKGTQKRGTGEIARETRAAGGYLNAGTIYEHTSYYTVLPAESFATGLEIQADALLNSLTESNELAREAQVVIQEIKRKLDSPNSYSYEKLLELAFEEHRIRRWRMGYESQVAAWTRDDLMRYYQSRYRPQNIILSIVGDIQTDSALALIRQHYSEFSSDGFATEFSPLEPPQESLKYRRMTADITRNIVHVGFHAPGIREKDFYSLVVLNFILGGGRSSRLYRAVKEEQGLAETIETAYDSFEQMGYFVISAEQDNGQPLPLLVSIFEQLDRFKRGAVAGVELERALNQLESGYLHSHEEVNAQAQTYAEYESYGDFQLADRYLEKLRAVTADDIKRVAREYFNVKNCSIIEYLPADSQFVAYSADNLGEKLSGSVYVSAGEQIAKVDIAPKTMAAVGGARLPDQPVKKAILDNGITLICRENHALPLISVAAYFYGGSFSETERSCGLTRLMAKTAIKGTSELSAAEIAARFEYLGSSLGYEVDDDYFGFVFDSMSRNFEPSFEIFSGIVLDPAFAPEEVDKEKKDLIAAINRQKDSMSGYPLELCRQTIFEGHSYGLPSLGISEAIERFEADDLKERYAQLARSGNLVIAFMGDITLAQATELTNKYLGRMPAGERLPTPFYDIKIDKTHTKLEKRNKAQTAQAFAFLTCAYADPDYEPLKVLQNIVSGMGGRLWTEVRDKRSLAYSTYCNQSSGALAGSFICYLATSPETAFEARQIGLNVLTGFGKAPLTDEELQLAINYTAGSFSIFLQANAARADLYARWELSGKGYQAVDEYPDEIRSVTAEQVLAVADKYLSSKAIAIGMVEGEGGFVGDRE